MTRCVRCCVLLCVRYFHDPLSPWYLEVIFRKRALWLVALLRKETCDSWHPMHLRHPICHIMDPLSPWFLEGPYIYVYTYIYIYIYMYVYSVRAIEVSRCRLDAPLCIYINIHIHIYMYIKFVQFRCPVAGYMSFYIHVYVYIHVYIYTYIY